MKRILINAIYPEECRVAIAENERVLELEIERSDNIQSKGNIYKAAVSRIEPSLQAAFIDIGSNRNGFLQINDVHPAYYNPNNTLNNEKNSERRNLKFPIQDALRVGQEIVVQVVKDERALKGATLSTNLSLPGRFLVLNIGSQKGGVSRRINDEGQRNRLKSVLQDLEIPAGMSVIVRTAGLNRQVEELQEDLNHLLEVWYEIVKKSCICNAPNLLYQEADLPIRTIRDYLSPQIEEVLVDDEKTYLKARQFVELSMPSFLDKVKYFNTSEPLFTHFSLDSQIEATALPEVNLPSGGSIVINMTEAIVAIDVNSGRATSQSDVEETAFQTNLEAAREVATQMRLRDLGGLIVIDFIDMNDRKHCGTIEKALRDSVKHDKAKIEFGRLSKFGLMELSRQRIKTSLTAQSHTNCPLCLGRGRIKTAETSVLEVLRKIQSTVYAGGISSITVRMSGSAALMLLNSKRRMLTEFEDRSKSQITIIADGRLRPEEYELEIKTPRSEETITITPTTGQINRNVLPERKRNKRNNKRKTRVKLPDQSPMQDLQSDNSVEANETVILQVEKSQIVNE